MKMFRAVGTTALIALSLVSARVIAHAQTGSSETDEPKHLSVRDVDRAAATNFSELRFHVLPRSGSKISTKDLAAMSLGTITKRPAGGAGSGVRGWSMQICPVRYRSGGGAVARLLSGRPELLWGGGSDDGEVLQHLCRRGIAGLGSSGGFSEEPRAERPDSRAGPIRGLHEGQAI